MTYISRDYAKEEKQLGRFMCAALFVVLSLGLLVAVFWVKTALWVWSFFV